MDRSKNPHVTITEDGKLCSMGQHRPGFPRVLYDTLLHVGYNGDVLIYRARVSMAHSMEQCEVNVMIPIRPEEPWSVTVMGVELDDFVDKTAHFALASLCGSYLADTTTMPLALFPFCYQGDPLWQQHFEAVSDPKGPHYHTGMAAMAEYTQGLFNLQHSTDTTVVQQHLWMAACEESYTATSRELTQLKCENDLLRGGTTPPSEQDQVLKVAYRRLNDAEHAWHYIHQKLVTSREMVDERPHAIIHLEHSNEQQDFELAEGVAMITSLEH
jgi:hypothetical protein